MAESEMSSIIRRLHRIQYLLEHLIIKQKEVRSSIEDKAKEIKNPHNNWTIARAVGAGASTVGAGLMGASVRFQDEDRSIMIAFGLAGVTLGKVVSLYTDIVDEVKSKNFIKDVKDIVASQNDLAKQLQEALDEFQQFIKTIKNPLSRILLEKIGFNPEEKLGKKRQRLMIDTQPDISTHMQTDVDYKNLVENTFKKVGQIQRAVSYHTPNETKEREPAFDAFPLGKTISRKRSSDVTTYAGEKSSNVLLTMRAVGAMEDIAKVIHDWMNKDEIEEIIDRIRERLTKSIAHLQCFLKTVEMNVQFLEEKNKD